MNIFFLFINKTIWHFFVYFNIYDREIGNRNADKGYTDKGRKKIFWFLAPKEKPYGIFWVGNMHVLLFTSCTMLFWTRYTYTFTWTKNFHISKWGMRLLEIKIILSHLTKKMFRLHTIWWYLLIYHLCRKHYQQYKRLIEWCYQTYETNWVTDWAYVM